MWENIKIIYFQELPIKLRWHPLQPPQGDEEAENAELSQARRLHCRISEMEQVVPTRRTFRSRELCKILSQTNRQHSSQHKTRQILTFVGAEILWRVQWGLVSADSCNEPPSDDVSFDIYIYVATCAAVFRIYILYLAWRGDILTYLYVCRKTWQFKSPKFYCWLNFAHNLTFITGSFHFHLLAKYPKKDLEEKSLPM